MSDTYTPLLIDLFCLFQGEQHFECDVYNYVTEQWSAYYFLYLFLAIFLIPSLVMVFAYGRTALALYRSIAAARKLVGDKG